MMEAKAVIMTSATINNPINIPCFGVLQLLPVVVLMVVGDSFGVTPFVSSSPFFVGVDFIVVTRLGVVKYM